MRTSQGVALVVYNMPNRNHCSRQRMQNSIRQHIRMILPHKGRLHFFRRKYYPVWKTFSMRLLL